MPKRTRRKRPPQEPVQTSISGLSHEGRGIAQIDGKTTFVFGALPDETVTFKYSKCHKQYDEAAVISVEKSSKDRVHPKCDFFGVCGGCSLQHMAEPTQIAHKQAVLLEHFAHQADCQPKTIAAPIQASPWGYRRKARLSVRYVPKKNKVLVGFREQDARFVADITRCEILHPSVGGKIEHFSDLLMQLEAKASIPQIEIAVGDAATAIIVRHLEPLSAHDSNKLIEFANQHQLSLYLQPKGPNTIHLVTPEAEDDALYYDLPSYDIRMRFHPSQFTQVNQAINLKMLDQALDWLALNENDQVLDLFCGIGNFSLPIAKKAAHVVGVEGSDFAILQAKKNATLNQIHNADFYVHDLTLPVELAAWSQKKYDKVLLDPARAGAKEIIAYIKQWSPSRVVYVSCNPITLARDTKDLLDLGYQLEKAGVMDMFPHTQHVEAMALFTKV